ncbi:MAG: hypothetical protein VW618_12290, partial [Alphaproteobacteria bacterium]
MTGIVLSAPFLSIDGDTRVYAATIVIDGLLAALGAFRLFGARASSREILMPIAVLLMLTAAAAFMPTDLRARGVAIV